MCELFLSGLRSCLCQEELCTSSTLKVQAQYSVKYALSPQVQSKHSSGKYGEVDAIVGGSGSSLAETGNVERVSPRAAAALAESFFTVEAAERAAKKLEGLQDVGGRRASSKRGQQQHTTRAAETSSSFAETSSSQTSSASTRTETRFVDSNPPPVWKGGVLGCRIFPKRGLLGACQRLCDSDPDCTMIAVCPLQYRDDDSNQVKRPCTVLGRDTTSSSLLQMGQAGRQPSSQTGVQESKIWSAVPHQS